MVDRGMRRRVAFVADTSAHLPLYERISTELGRECEVRLYPWAKMGEILPFDRLEVPQISSKRSLSGAAAQSVWRVLKRCYRKNPQALRDAFHHLAVAGLYAGYLLKLLPEIFAMRSSDCSSFRVAFCTAVVRDARNAALSGMRTRNAGAQRFVRFRRLLHLLPLWHDAYRSTLLAHQIISDRVDLVVFPEDNIVSGAALLLSQSLERLNSDITTVTIQYTMGVEAEWRQAFAKMSQSSRAKRLSARIIRRMWPNMYDEADGIPYAFPMGVCTRIDAMQVVPVAPWSGYGGNVAFYIVDTQQEYDIATASVPPSVEVVLAEALEVTQVKRLRRNSLLTGPRTGITISLPPNHFEGDLESASVTTYEAFIDQLLGRMAVFELLGHRVRYCAHPRLTHEPAYGLFQERGIEIELDLLSALADSSLLITFGSAVRRFASDLSITAIDWDVFGFRGAEVSVCNQPESGTGVALVANVQQFDAALKECISSSPMNASKNSEADQRPEIADVLRGLLRGRVTT